jgi:hypothetical protein
MLSKEGSIVVLSHSILRAGLLPAALFITCVLSTAKSSLAAAGVEDQLPGFAAAGDSGSSVDTWYAQAPPLPTPKAPAQSQPSKKPVQEKTAPSLPKVPPPAPEERPAPPAPDLLASMFNTPGESRYSERLAGTPNMFGDLFNNLGGSVLVLTSAFDTTQADIPLAAGCRRAKIAEDDKALPQNRVFFLYNHFQNALSNQSDVTGFLVPHNLPVDRYTLGIEKTLFDEVWSVELRMPLAGRSEYDTPEFGIWGGSVGNLAVILKRLIYQSDTAAVAVGLGIDAPIGSDANGFADDYSNTTFFTVHNQAVHLAPYAGFLRAPNCRLFYQGFVQCDVPLNGNRIDYTDSVDSGTIGVLNEQNLLYVDFSAGYWLYRNCCAPWFTGLAAVAEVHYTTALQDADVVAKVGYPPPRLIFSNFANRVDVVNLTAGLHAEIARDTVCRVGGVFPLSRGDDRSFDGEVQVQLEHRF